jgi:hypothetical protein
MTARVPGENPKVLERVLEGGIWGHERIKYATVTEEQGQLLGRGEGQRETWKPEPKNRNHTRETVKIKGKPGNPNRRTGHYPGYREGQGETWKPDLRNGYLPGKRNRRTGTTANRLRTTEGQLERGEGQGETWKPEPKTGRLTGNAEW